MKKTPFLGQAEVLKELTKDQLNQIYAAFEEERSFKKTFNFLRSGARSIPHRLIDDIASSLHPTHPVDAAKWGKKVRLAIQKDRDGQADFWNRCEFFLSALKMRKLVYEPFTDNAAEDAKSIFSDNAPFIDVFLSCFHRFTGHQVEMKPEKDLSHLLNRLTDNQHRTVRVGVGVLSSLDRLTQLAALKLPQRIGLNAVVLAQHWEAHHEEISCVLIGKQPKANEKLWPIVVEHDVGYNHLIGLGIDRIDFDQDLKLLDSDAMFHQLTLARDRVSFIVSDEATCLSVLQSAMKFGMRARLIFPLATDRTVKSDKTRLPEFMLSIVLKRDDHDAISYLQDAFHQILQTEVELLGQTYADAVNALTVFARDGLLAEVGLTHDEAIGGKFPGLPTILGLAESWAYYTLRLGPGMLESYVDTILPWRPILHRASQILNAESDPPKRKSANVEYQKVTPL